MKNPDMWLIILPVISAILSAVQIVALLVLFA